MLGIVLILLTVGASAAAQPWGVMEYLFGKNQEIAAPYVQPVSCVAENELVRMNINSALCDGQHLVFDWTITPLQPSRTVRLSLESFTANGEQLWTDGNDDFDDCWLPNPWSDEAVMQDGDRVALPESLKGVDILSVEMVIGVYEPTLPVYVIPHDDAGRLGFDPELAREKIRAGYMVMYDSTGWVVEDDKEDDGIACVVGFTLQEGDPFARTELRVSFTVDAAACAAAAQVLSTAESYVEYTTHDALWAAAIQHALEHGRYDFGEKYTWSFRTNLCDIEGDADNETYSNSVFICNLNFITIGGQKIITGSQDDLLLACTVIDSHIDGEVLELHAHKCALFALKSTQKQKECFKLYTDHTCSC